MLKTIHAHKVVYLPVLCLLILFGVFILAGHLLIPLLAKDSLLPQDESYTELYLNNHLDLPKELLPDQVATASFTIHNVEHKKMNYHYVISRSIDQDKEIIVSGSAVLADNQSESIAFDYTVATKEPKTKIEILLPEKRQSIHFWINNQ